MWLKTGEKSTWKWLQSTWKSDNSSQPSSNHFSHLSIFYICFIISGSQEGWSLLGLSLGKGGVHPGQVQGSSQGYRDKNRTTKNACTFILIPINDSESQLNLTTMILDCGGFWSTQRKATQTQDKHANSEIWTRKPLTVKLRQTKTTTVLPAISSIWFTLVHLHSANAQLKSSQGTLQRT